MLSEMGQKEKYRYRIIALIYVIYSKDRIAVISMDYREEGQEDHFMVGSLSQIVAEYS